MELPFDQAADGSHGFKALGGKYPTNSIAWYRRTFELPREDEGRRISLTFDGVFRDATVWVNGWCVRHHEGGYYPFREDITDVVHYGGKNTIAVLVDATKTEGWFYEGAGIYRHVWLDKTAPVAIAPDGIFVYSTFKNNVPEGDAELHIQTRLKNTKTNSVFMPLVFVISSPEGKMLQKFQQTVTVPPASEMEIRNSTTMKDCDLWSPESPKLYKLWIGLGDLGNGQISDGKTAFGLPHRL